MDDVEAMSESEGPIKSEQVEPDHGSPDINSDELDYEAYVEKILEGVKSKDSELVDRAVLGELKNNDDPKEVEFMDFEREIPEFYVKQESCEVKLEVNELIIKPEAEEIEVQPDSFECSTCGKSLKDRVCLEIHELVHKDPPPLRVWKVHRARSKLWKCEECGYKTNRLGSYEEHLLGHEDPPKVLMYRCQFCGYTSRSKHEVLSHTKVIHAKAIHEKVIPEKVTHAKAKHAKAKHAKAKHAKDKSTRNRETRHRNSNKRILQDHSTQKASTELKAYVCSSCDYQTFIKQKFIKHVIVHKHKKGNIFRCTECYCETKCKDSFDKHIRRHRKQTSKKQHAV